MRDPIVIGVAAIIALLMIPAIVWLALAIAGGEGCAWILGYGGCLPR